MHPYSLAEVNQLSHLEFVSVFGAVFEATSEIATQTWQYCPFESFEELYQTMQRLVRDRDRTTNLRLLQAHPDLGGKMRMAPASVQEQTGVGLTTLSEIELKRFQELNQAYRKRFGFPFIIAVRNHTKTSILEAFQTRLRNSSDQEYSTALSEVMQIAWYRLADLVSE